MKQLGRFARSPVAWLLIAALAVRLGAGAWWQSRLPPGTRFAFSDSESYWALARAIATGATYEFGDPPARAFRTPGYPLLLAPLFVAYRGDPPVAAARALGAVLGTCAVGGVYLLGERLFSRRVGLIAAIFATFYPGAISMSVFVLSEAAFCPLLLAQLIVTAAALQAFAGRASNGRHSLHATIGKPLSDESARASITGKVYGLSFVSGLLAGAATLVRPSWLLFTPLAIVALMLNGRNFSPKLRLGATMLAGLAIAMAPWWVRNYAVLGHFVATTTEVGASLYDGLNPRATGASEMSFRPEFVAIEEQEPAGDKPLEYRLDRRMQSAACEWAAAHPGRVLQLAAVKVVRLWNVWPNEAEFRSLAIRAIVFASYVPLALLALVGAVRFTSSAPGAALCWLPAVYLTLLHIVFVSSIRYREPAMLPLCVLASAVLASIKPTPRAAAI